MQRLKKNTKCSKKLYIGRRKLYLVGLTKVDHHLSGIQNLYKNILKNVVNYLIVALRSPINDYSKIYHCL